MTAPLDPTPAAPRPRKRAIAFFVFLGVVVVAGIGGLLYWHYASQYEETDDAAVDGRIVSISPQVAGRISAVHVRDNQDVKAGELLAEIDSTDFITAVNQAKAALQAASARREVARTNVDLVKASTDAALTQANAAVITAQAVVEQAQAGIEQAQAGVESAQATVHWAEAQVQSAQADVDAAQAEATRREADVKRYEAVDPRALSQQVRDAARAAADASAAQLAATQRRKLAADALVAQEQSKLGAAKAALAEARSGVAQARSRVAQAQGALQEAQTAPQQIANAEAQVKTAAAGVDQAQAAFDAAQQQLSYTKIMAPITGRITRKAVQVGLVVDVGRNLLAIVEPEVWVTANFKETQLARMHVGQAVEIRVDAYPGRVFQGKIESFQSGTGARFSLMPPENATGNYVKVVQRVPVKITFNEDAWARQLLGPGMSVVPRVRIGGNEGTPAPIAPATTGPR